MNLTCNVAVAKGWKYQWRRDGVDLTDDGKTISIILPPSGGTYQCQATRGEISTEFNEEITLDVNSKR